MNINNKFYTIEQAAEVLGVSEQEVLNMVTSKKLPAIKVDKAIKIEKEGLEEFLNNLEGRDTNERVKTADTVEADSQSKHKVKMEAEGIIMSRKALLEKSYRELLKKKQELEEDINYLQYEYDEFKSRIKKLIKEELNMFLRKIDKENLKENDEIIHGNFEHNMDIGESISEISEDKTGGYNDKEKALVLEDSERSSKGLKLGEENQFRLKGNNSTDDS